MRREPRRRWRTSSSRSVPIASSLSWPRPWSARPPGAVPPVGDYFKRIRAICDRYGVLLILDEVMCGMGRTGTLHACEQEGIAPDLMAVAKGLGGGYQPIGAVMLTKRIYEAFAKGSGAFQHGHTYMGHPMAAAAALAVQDVIRRDGLLANVVGDGRKA